MEKKQTLMVSALCIALTTISVGCSEPTANSVSNPVITVDELTATLRHEYDGRSYSGTIEEKSGTPLSFNGGGTVMRVYVRMGDVVHRGQIVAMVDTTSASDALEMSRASLRQAEDSYERMKQLHDAGSLPDIKWVETLSKVDQARIAEKMARKRLDDCRLTAPSDGTIASADVEVGQVVAPGAPVISLVTDHELEVSISVPEAEVGSFAKGQRAGVKVAAVGSSTYPATVVERGVKADALSRSYTVRLRLDGVHSGVLPGMVASVMMESASGSAAFVIPAQAVMLADDNANFVWVDEGGVAVRKPVVCSGFVPDGVTVSSGLAEGDRVIWRGQQKICSGMSVEASK